MNNAAILTTNHIGNRITYGPHGMFTGILDHVEHLSEPWLTETRNRTWDEPPVTEIETPPRVLVRTVDGRYATLAYDHPVRLEATGGEEGATYDQTQLGEGQTEGPSESSSTR